ncbi:MAG: rod shape-determining protein MreD [Rhodobacteraceae bacterium]|nr:rod shape-determining protein MreD [Paracoccaceae bacterium]
MAETTGRSLKWPMRLAYVGLSLLFLALAFLPFQTVPRGWAGPDWIVVLTLAWAARRPDYVPVLAVGLVVLLADFLLMRPPGLLAALMVIARQVLRHRATALRDAPFPNEWLTVAGIMVVITVAERLAYAIFLLDQPPLGLALMRLVTGILAYPVAVFASQLLLGLRKPQPGDDDTLVRPA